MVVSDPLVNELGSMNQRAPLAVRSSIIKIVCNAWATSSRMHSARVGCRFGCGLESGDPMLHYLNCTCPRRAALRYLTLPPVIEDALNL
eukprot:10000003-Heterocapsa_arctica.AAC.1